MKKLISIFIILFLTISSLLAQNSYREKGTIGIDGGIGLSAISTFSSDYSLVVPPVKVDVGYTVLSVGAFSLSVGGYFSLGVDRVKFSDYNYQYDSNLTMNFTQFLVGPMGNVRYALSDNFDIFGKLIFGFYGIAGASDILVSNVRGSGVGGGAFVGGTWYFSPKMGVGAEFGAGGPTRLGVHLTFKI